MTKAKFNIGDKVYLVYFDVVTHEAKLSNEITVTAIHSTTRLIEGVEKSSYDYELESDRPFNTYEESELSGSKEDGIKQWKMASKMNDAMKRMALEKPNQTPQ